MPENEQKKDPADDGKVSPSEPKTSPGERDSTDTSERKDMIRSAGVVGFMTILSRILGLWRDRLMGAIFGATGINDAFQLAFILPNLTRRLFGEGALSAAFVPVFSERLATGRKEAANRTASVLLTRLASGLLLVCLILIAASLAARSLTDLPQQLDLTLRLSEIMLCYCVLINVAAVLMGVLNSLRHFAAPAFAPVLLNVSMIAACLWGLGLLGDTSDSQITVVALAVMAGGILQLLIMLPPAFTRGFRFRPCLDKTDEGYTEVMRGFAPVVVGVALFQINVLMDKVIAWVLIPEDGPVTMLAYGNRLIQLPWAVFSLALATAALPLLSRYWAEEKKDAFQSAVNTAVRNTLFLALPSSVGLCLLSTDLVRLFYGAGEFLQNDGEAVIRTGRVVALLALGLCFYSLNSILARALYATKDTRAPTRSAAFSVVVNLVLNLVFVLGTDLKEAGLALASAISGASQTLFMLRALLRKTTMPDTKRMAAFAVFVGGAAAIGGLGAWWVYTSYGSSQDVEGFLAFAIAGAVSLAPLALAGKVYFSSQLKALDIQMKASDEKDEKKSKPWPGDLILYHSIYTTALSCMIMGLLVWAVRDSLPPGEHSFALVFQRGVVPVAAGVAVFLVAAGSVQSREYEEIKTAFARRMKKDKQDAKEAQSR